MGYDDINGLDNLPDQEYLRSLEAGQIESDIRHLNGKLNKLAEQREALTTVTNSFQYFDIEELEDRYDQFREKYLKDKKFLAQYLKLVDANQKLVENLNYKLHTYTKSVGYLFHLLENMMKKNGYSLDNIKCTKFVSPVWDLPYFTRNSSKDFDEILANAVNKIKILHGMRFMGLAIKCTKFGRIFLENIRIAYNPLDDKKNEEYYNKIKETYRFLNETASEIAKLKEERGIDPEELFPHTKNQTLEDTANKYHSYCLDSYTPLLPDDPTIDMFLNPDDKYYGTLESNYTIYQDDKLEEKNKTSQSSSNSKTMPYTPNATF